MTSVGPPPSTSPTANAAQAPAIGDPLRSPIFWMLALLGGAASLLPIVMLIDDHLHDPWFAAFTATMLALGMLPATQAVTRASGASAPPRWLTAMTIAVLQGAVWWLLAAAFQGWTDTRWLDAAPGASAAIPSGVALVGVILCAATAALLVAVTTLAPAVAIVSGGGVLQTMRRVVGARPPVVSLSLGVFAAVVGTMVASGYIAILAAFGGTGVGLYALPIIAAGGFIVWTVTTVWLARVLDAQEIPATPRLRVGVLAAALGIAAVGILSGQTLDHGPVDAPLDRVLADPMATFVPTGGQLGTEVRRGPKTDGPTHGGETIESPEPEVYRYFLLGNEQTVAVAEAASAARAAGWSVTPGRDGSSVTGTRIKDGLTMTLGIEGSEALQCPAGDTNPSCASDELRITVRSAWRPDAKTDLILADPMTQFVPPRTTAGSSRTVPGSIEREYIVADPAGDDVVIAAGNAAARAATAGGWKMEAFSQPGSWVGEKRFGDQLVRMRIDVDLLTGDSGTWVDGKSGTVKLLFLQVDR